MAQHDILTPELRAQFLKDGYIKIDEGIPPENVARYISNVWTRLGWDKDDKSTWVEETVHLPRHREEPHVTYMPKVYQAACELVSGEDKLDHDLFTTSGDSLIINVGTEHWETNEQHPRDLGNWHIDGDWFIHYLDSSDQGLVIICLFTDVETRGGPTYICPKALPAVTKYMYEHPEGGMDHRVVVEAMEGIEEYVELTGKAGDVYICHPFMPHSRSRNHKRNFRAITNPPCTLLEPFNYDRPDGDYTLLEQVVLNSLNVPCLPGWHITGPRRRFPPKTQPGKMAKVQAELARMQTEADRTGVPVDSLHMSGAGLEQWKLNKYADDEGVVAPPAVATAVRV